MVTSDEEADMVLAVCTLGSDVAECMGWECEIDTMLERSMCLDGPADGTEVISFTLSGIRRSTRLELDTEGLVVNETFVFGTIVVMDVGIVRDACTNPVVSATGFPYVLSIEEVLFRIVDEVGQGVKCRDKGVTDSSIVDIYINLDTDNTAFEDGWIVGVETTVDVRARVPDTNLLRKDADGHAAFATDYADKTFAGFP